MWGRKIFHHQTQILFFAIFHKRSFFHILFLSFLYVVMFDLSEGLMVKYFLKSLCLEKSESEAEKRKKHNYIVLFCLSQTRTKTLFGSHNKLSNFYLSFFTLIIIHQKNSQNLHPHFVKGTMKYEKLNWKIFILNPHHMGTTRNRPELSEKMKKKWKTTF